MMTSRMVLVTGGASGLGREVVKRLAEEKYDICFTYNKSVEQATKLKDYLQDTYKINVETVRCDLASKEQVDSLCRDLKNFLPVYGYVANAAQTYDQLSALAKEEELETLFQVNFFSALKIYRSIVRSMTRQKKGRIVFISSIAASRGSRGNSSYAATKGALEAFANCAVAELRGKDVTLNIVAPGFVQTGMMEKYSDYTDEMMARIPAGRFAEPTEVADVVAFLMSDSSSYVNGAKIVVDGGAFCTLG